jgi:outer membrane lipoprotein-sorting protein
VLKKVAIPLFLFFLLYLPLSAQQGDDTENNVQAPESGGVIISVNDVKDRMAKKFESIKDYTADFQWINGEAHYHGKLQYKKPDKILLTFDEPQEQKIVSNGNFLYIYIPYLKVVVQQLLSEDTESSILATTSEEGLTRLFDEYSFSFFDSSVMQPYRSTRAYHLRLTQKTPKVGFKRMDLWVAGDGTIMQSNGLSPNGINVSLVFSNVRINTELPDYIFDFEVPADAQIIRNIIVPFME